MNGATQKRTRNETESERECEGEELATGKQNLRHGKSTKQRIIKTEESERRRLKKSE